MNLFGKRKPSGSAPSSGGGALTKDAIARLHDAEEQLTKREEHLTRKAAHELAEAKKFSADKNKRAALTALRRKKLFEVQLEKVSASKMTLEQQRMALEQVNISKVTYDAIDLGKRELERLNKEMGVERVEETMDDLQEQIELQNETADALARPLNAFGIGTDEDELQRELEELEQGVLDEHILKIDATVEQPAAMSAPAAPSAAAERPLPMMPSAPTTKVQETQEERELRELEESMAM
ncbi:hypothetical protein KFE25_009013 [Diacronema lutheri]|uniref:Uncharacterized protein n=1 Tax=Diacronema lutheri TaxID=2081491 RepID=A0A8J5XXK0_DIALT|nr:hypothetical protein KFE25_009013 [Diacronema lutheri]